MSLDSSQSSPFEQADRDFDLGRLRADLEVSGQIDPQVWRYLKGILCGLDKEEIAKQCFVGKGTVNTALSRGVSSQILRILPGEDKVDWKCLRQLLIEAGYGRGENHRINWQQICRAMLDRQKKLSTNEVIASEAMQFDLLDDEVFVSLALIERKEPDRVSQEVRPERPTDRYEEKPPIEYEVFREQVLRQGKSDRIAIVGEPGAGKTTLLQHIAFWILDQKLGLPIWISLGDLIKNGELQRLKDYLTQVWLEDAISDVTEEIRSDFLKQLGQQRIWFLLDGADEIVASSGITLREVNNQLRSWLAQSHIVLTCRVNVWDADINALRDFQTYRTKEFHYPTQVEQFIRSGFRKSDELSGERLRTALALPEQARLQQLACNPLRLMMLCTTWHEHESLPATKAELYKRFVSEFYKWNRTKWKKKDLNYGFFPNTVAQQEKLNQALGRLACRALDKEASPFRLSYELVFSELGDPDEDGSDFWLALNLGWLQIARDSDEFSEKVYTFFHPTFQEYFAALAICDEQFFLKHSVDNPSLSESCYRVFEPKFKEVLLLWLGRDDKTLEDRKNRLIRELIEFKDGCLGCYEIQAIFIAAACTAEFKDCKLSDLIVLEASKLYFGFFDQSGGKWQNFLDPIPLMAELALLETDTEKLVETIISAFIPDSINNTHPNADVALKAAKILGLLGENNSKAIDVLIQIIQCKDFYQYVPVQNFFFARSEASKSLIKIAHKSEPAINRLKNILHTAVIKEEQDLIVKTLGRISPGDPLPREFLKRRMNSSNNADDRLQAAWSMLSFDSGDVTARDTLFELSSSSDNYISYQAKKLLEQGSTITYNYDAHEYSQEEITESEKFWMNSKSNTDLLGSNSPNLARSWAIQEILEYAKSDYPRVVEELTKQLFTCTDTLTLQIIIEILGRISVGDEKVVEILIDFVQNSNNLLAVTVRVFDQIINSPNQRRLCYLTVLGLKSYLQNQQFTSTMRYIQIYQIVWLCAQRIRYSDFYQAWHESLDTTNAELPENDHDCTT